jgi:hypothetical protein
MKTIQSVPKFNDFRDYCHRTRTKRIRLAKELGVSRFQYAGLQDPFLYPVPDLTAELVAKIARLWNQSESYVRDYYRRSGCGL